MDLKGSCDFIEQAFEVKLARSTVHGMLHRLGFSSRVMQTNRGGYKLDKNQILELTKNFLNQLTDEGFFNHHLNMIGSFDFTFTSQRTYRPRTYAPRGG